MFERLLSRAFIRKLRKSSPKEVAALLGAINLDQSLVEKVVKKVRNAGYHVLTEDEVADKRLTLKSLLHEQSYRDLINPQLQNLFLHEIKSRGEAAVRDLIETLEINYSTLPVLRSVLGKYGLLVLPRSVFWNLRDLDDARFLEKLENERGESLVRKVFGDARRFERRTAETIADYIDPPKDLVEIAGRLNLIPFGSFSLDSIASFLFWSPERRSVIEVVVLDESFYAVRGSKHFLVVDVEDFKSEIDDVDSFMEYLRNVVREFRFQTVFINRITPNMIPYRRRATVYEMEKTSKELDEERRRLKHLQVSLIYTHNPFERRDIERFMRERKERLKELQRRYEKLKEEYEKESSIVKEWLDKGVAVSFMFSVKSTTYIVKKEDLPDAINFVLMDLETEAKAIKPRAAQKHHLLIEEVPYPSVGVISEIAGIDNPNSLLQYAEQHPEIQPLLETAEQMYLPRPGADIKVNGETVKAPQSPARAIQRLLEKVYEHFGMMKEAFHVPVPSRDKIPNSDLLIGSIVGPGFRTLEIPAYLEADKLVLNALITGVVGSGKTTAAKIIVEKLRDRALILVIDPTGVWKNLVEGTVVEDSSGMLEFPQIGLMILDLEKFSEEDKGRVAAGFLEELYDRLPRNPSERLRFLAVIEEFHRLIPGINEVLERCMRELRKYGAGFILISHSIPDIGLIRGFVNIRLHFRTGYEPDLRRIAQSYGTEYARLMNRLPTGIALHFFHEYNDAKPYFIKFGEYPEALRITGDERKVLGQLEEKPEQGIRELWSKTGFGWNKFYRILRTLQSKGLVEIKAEGKMRKVALKSRGPT